MSAPTKVAELMERAVAFFGSEAKLGRAIGSSQNAVWHAKRQGRVSAEMASAIDRATGGTVKKAELRPDLWTVDGAASPPHVQRNWIVETGSALFGSSTICIPATELQFTDGALVFLDAEGKCSTVFAAGCWSQAVEGTPSNPEPDRPEQNPLGGSHERAVQ